MIVTPTAARNLARVDEALRASRAVLVQGTVGSGKSACVQHLAAQHGMQETMVQINVDDSFDSKDLLGKFCATDVPGAFEWVPGPLTLAVERGLWVLMEDIDLASFDVFSVIQPLLESGTLFVSDRNRSVVAHDNFRLIATQQLQRSSSISASHAGGVKEEGDGGRARAAALTMHTRRGNGVPYAELWATTVLEELGEEEMCAIVSEIYPIVPHATLEALSQVNDEGTNGSTVIIVTLRHLLRWARRVSRRLLASAYTTEAVAVTRSTKKGGELFVSSTMRELMLREAYDCMVARFPVRSDMQRYALRCVAAACGVPEGVAEPLVLNNKPLQSLTDTQYTIGRVTLSSFSTSALRARESRIAFAPTQHAMSLLERLAVAVDAGEHVLLTGETGVGKTFIVQYLADQIGQKLVVLNLNQQTDTADFMGGWKPLDHGHSVRELYTTFIHLFSQSFNVEKEDNIRFLRTLQRSLQERKWIVVTRQICKGCEQFAKRAAGHTGMPGFSDTLHRRWQALMSAAVELYEMIKAAKTSFTFRFEEGSLVRAWREGWWILLDEVNLAATEVLERIAAVLGEVDKLFLTDRGDSTPVLRHRNFHVFANMNPPTDVGKKDLPLSLRSRFTEYYVSEPFTPGDIAIVVQEYVGFLTPDAKIDEITAFFLDCVANAKSKLCSLDGETKPPSFSLRTLTRALTYVRRAAPLYGYLTALYDGLLLGFATPLQRQFHAVLEELLVKNIFRNRRPPAPTLPAMPANGDYVAFEHIWLPAGSQVAHRDPNYIITDSVRCHLTDLARAVFASRPVLLEGPTSSGKSSMVKFLAELSGNRFVRINNHDSTDVQEYLGHYITDEHGKLRFVDGILASAVRYGCWVVLDELNLAPTDVLEALNRLLDDNGELFIPDTQETIKAHPQLRVFATQNPAGVYGGRKLLSRAFRNRFLEITVDDLPTSEISAILEQRYTLPSSFAGKMVEVMVALQLRRQGSQLFAGRHGFITPRDLFRWAERHPTTYAELAEHGFLLLGERCRRPAERLIVKDVMEQVMKVELDETVMYSPAHWPFVHDYYKLIQDGVLDNYHIVWTPSMQRLFTIVGLCLQHREPVLLVGETGSSKTTVCQLWAALLNLPLHILNCHQHTEAADFLGGLRPAPPERRARALFEWHNGPLIQSMLHGDLFVLDEISLAEDSVLERLNSVLEPQRSVTLAEKSSADFIVADERFRLMATMNPGGDFGKKELSPALRNRFTEIYVRPTTAQDEVALILSRRLTPSLQSWAQGMAALLCSISANTQLSGTVQHVSIRDIIDWVAFMNAAHGRCADDMAFLHGLDAVILDGIGVGTGQSDVAAQEARQMLLSKVIEAVPVFAGQGTTELELMLQQRPFWDLMEGMSIPELPAALQRYFFFGAPTTQRNLSKLMRATIMRKAVLLEGSPGVGKTSIVEALGAALQRPVVRINLSEQTDMMDLLGTYLPSPAGGVTATDAATADLKDATDAIASGAASGPRFAWSDGVLLRAVKEGAWVILDELNLANQSVLEGLNALLDHRATVFIPELNREFAAHAQFRVFACQNPLVEGGGRKGLPRSFLNRFLKVRIEAFDTTDLLCIGQAIFPDLPLDTLRAMVGFVAQLQQDTMVRRIYGARGSPWEFNLRDVLRWAKLMAADGAYDRPAYFADMLFLQRMRSAEDEAGCLAQLRSYFPRCPMPPDARNSDFIVQGGVVFFEGRRLCTRQWAGGMMQTDTAQCGTTPPSPPLLQRPLLLLPSQARLIRSVLLCAAQAQFVLLVGPTASGKSFVLHTAAALAGAKLVTFSINANCDTVDLLGGFDQVAGQQGQFEWRDSLVLEAMQHGYWLVLDNVNYCNASVLDRLNPLVEPNGVLSINEQGLVRGEIRVVRPHPNFRLFATLNPSYGEVSRAMRNRAVELYVAPVAVPSVEATILCATTLSTVTPPVRRATWVDKLLRFHHTFVWDGFGADLRQPRAASTSDALAAGAPNLFTLHRACAMLRRRIDTVAPECVASEEDDAGHGTMCDIVMQVIRSCYLDNRSSGPWRYKQVELVHALQRQLSTPSPIYVTGMSEADDVTVPVTLNELVTAVQLERVAHISSPLDVEGVLVHARTRRAALPLTWWLASQGACHHNASQHNATTFPGRDDSDDEHAALLSAMVMYFVLDQCMDTLPGIDALAAARGTLLAALTEATSDKLPALADIYTRTSSLLNSKYSTADALDTLFCRVSEALAPHVRLLAAIDVMLVRRTDSTYVNEVGTRVLREFVAQLRQISSPLLWQDAMRAFVPFASELLLPFLPADVDATTRERITPDNYVPTATKAILLQTFLRNHADYFASSLQEHVRRFLRALQRHLELPFALCDAKPVLCHCTATPRITTVADRSAMQEWAVQLQLRADTMSGDEPAQVLLRSLWTTALYRAEFDLTQVILHSSMQAAQLSPDEGRLMSVHSMRDEVQKYIVLTTRTLPLLTEVDVALWRAVLTLLTRSQWVSGDELSVALQQYTPLLVSRFVTQHGTHGVRHLRAASWARAAVACVQGASQASVLALGNKETSMQTRLLDGLHTFLSACPRSSTGTFAVFMANTQLELTQLVRCCVQHFALPDRTTLAGTPSDLLQTLHECLASGFDGLNETNTVEQTIIARQGALLQHLTRVMAESGPSNTLCAATLLWALRCRLLLPVSPIDPMYQRECEIAAAQDALTLLDRLTVVFAWANRVTMRGPDTPHTALVALLRHHEVAVMERARGQYVARPERGGECYAALVRRLYRLCETLFCDERLLTIFAVAPTLEHRRSAAATESARETHRLRCATVVRERESWCELLVQQLVELLQQYGGYEDVLLPFAEAASLALVAAQSSCYELAALSSPSPQHRATLFDMDTTLQAMQFPRCTTQPWPLPAFGDRLATTDAAVPVQHVSLRHRVQYLDACLAWLTGTATQGVTRSFAEAVFAAFRALHATVEQLTAEERRAAETAVLYKEKAIEIEGDDAAALRKLRALFPNYEQDFVDFASAPISRNDAAENDEEETKFERRDGDDAMREGHLESGTEHVEMSENDLRSARQARLLLTERDGYYLRHLVETHLDFYTRLAAGGADTTLRLPTLLDAFSTRFDVLGSELSRYGDESMRDGGEAAEQLLMNGFNCRAVLLRHALQCDRGGDATATVQQRNAAGFNIYLDSDPAEMSRLSEPLQRLLTAVQSLMECFPDSVALQRCARVGQRLARLPALTTPMMKLMTGCEVLLRECYEWERDAAQEVSLITHMTSLSALVLRWRRLELHCWPYILKAKRAEFSVQACMRWFSFYDLIHGKSDTSEGGSDVDASETMLTERHCRRVFDAFSQFMWGAVYGDFDERLRLLQGFGFELLSTHGPTAPLTNVVLHLSDFFAQFAPYIAAQRASALAPIEEDMTQFTKIMRWEDATYHAVRASTEKSYLKTARVLSSVEGVLRTPVLGIITAEEQRCEEDTAMGLQPSPTSVSPSTAGVSCTAQDRRRQPEAAKRGRDGRRKRMKPLTETPEEDNATLGEWHACAVVGGYEFFVDSTQSIIERVSVLQAPKTPNALKTRALKTLFDVLATAGVPRTHEAQAASWEVLFATTETLLACRTVHCDQQPAATDLAVAAAELYRFVRWLQRMREAERTPHADLSSAQVRAGTGAAESLFAHALIVAQLVNTLYELRYELDALHTILAAQKSRETDLTTKCATAPQVARDARVRLLEDCVQLSCTARSVYMELSWLLHESPLHPPPAVTASEENMTAASASFATAFSEFGAACDALQALVTRYDVLRRGATVPWSVLQQYRTAMRDLIDVCDRLASMHEPRVRAAVVVLRGRIATTLDSLSPASTFAESDTPVLVPPAKRMRAEGKQSSWCAHAMTLFDVLDATLADDLPATAGAAAALTTPVTQDDAPVYDTYMTAITTMQTSIATTLSSVRVLATDAANATCDACADGDESGVSLRVRHIASTVAHIQRALQTTLHAHAKLGLVLARLMTILMTKGFCKTEQDDEDDAQGGEGEGGEGQLQQGTGMDDGEGVNDVTDQMENEDQLMNMKDKEPPQDGAEKKPETEQDDEEQAEKEDKAADVETDFQAEKERRAESEQDEAESEQDGDESEKEMGSVDGSEAQERKKSRKDDMDANDLSEDDGDGAEEVPEDDLAQDDGVDEETGGFANQEDAIREAEQERDGTHDLVGEDDKRSAMSDGDAERESESDSDATSSLTASDASTAPPDGDDRSSSDNGSDEGDTARQEEEEAEDTDAASEHNSRTPDGDGDETRCELDASDAEGSDVESGLDAPDENVYTDGMQDDNHTGEETTIRQDEPAADQERTTGQRSDETEQQRQPGQEQEEDESGRNWRRPQQEQQQQASAQNRRRDESARNQRAQHNPYRAVKEALRRQEQSKMQQLRLDKRVVIDDATDAQDTKSQHEAQSEVDEFDFDEEGDREAIAAMDEAQQSKKDEDNTEAGPAQPTESETVAEPPKETPTTATQPSSDAEEGNEDEPREDHRRRRRRGGPEVNEMDNEDEKGARHGRRKGGRSTSGRPVSSSSSSSDEDDEAAGGQNDVTLAHEITVDDALERGRRLWLEQEAHVQGLSQQLCEQLRLILAPTLADKLQGDYKTGKRLNMKRIIPYIASQFKKDRIWLRRTKPNKRTYQVMVALDDSLSMQSNNAGVMCCRAVALITKALQQLEVGEVGLVCFGTESKVVHELHEPFLADSGPRAFSEITFAQTSTNFKLFLENTLDYLDAARERMRGQIRSTTEQLQQVLFVLSDGQLTEDRAELRRLLVRAEDHHQMVVFVLLDIKAATATPGPAADAAGPTTSLTSADEGGYDVATRRPGGFATNTSTPLSPKELRGLSTAERMRRLKADRDARLKRVQSNSILDMQLVTFVGGKVERRAYMEDFPFPYYIIVRELNNLPEIIADAMRQWFELLHAGM